MKWLLQSFAARTGVTLRNPRYALDSFYREFTLADERCLSIIIGVSLRRIRAFLGEPIHARDFAARLRLADLTFRDLEIQSADQYAKKMLLQYIAVRAFQPETAAGTGAATGVSSAHILLAL